MILHSRTHTSFKYREKASNDLINYYIDRGVEDSLEGQLNYWLENLSKDEKYVYDRERAIHYTSDVDQLHLFELCFIVSDGSDWDIKNEINGCILKSIYFLKEWRNVEGYDKKRLVYYTKKYIG